MFSSGKNIKKTSKKILPAENNVAENIVENLYKKNIENLNKNKTLSLLGKLYEISILTLKPEELANRISQTVQVDLSLEMVAIYTYSEEKDNLLPLCIAKSKRTEDALKKEKITLHDLEIVNIKKRKILKRTLSLKEENKINNLKEIFGDLIKEKSIKKIVTESFIKTTLLNPLVIENKILGLMLFSLNRNYEMLSSFEKDSIHSIVNITSVALEKAFLYKELEDANIKLRELDRQKDELLSIVSHQLATPVSAVKWNLEMILDGDSGKLTKVLEENMLSLQSIAGDLSDLVSMILDVSRIQLGRMRIDKQELDLKIFFKEILNIIEPKAKEKQVNLKVSLPTSFPRAMLDKRYTHMTIENLLSNAVKYTPANGNVSFKVTVKNNLAHCEVKDTGVGIPKSEQDKIFGKLFRASNVRNTVDGNGFGLYVAKGATEAQGGKIWFESEEGKGTTFFVDLPLKEKKVINKLEPEIK